MPEHIDAEAVDASLEPEPHHVIQGAAHLCVAPVEVGLLLEKGVVIILLRCLIPGPGAAAEIAHPVVGGCAVGPCITPDVPIAIWACPRTAALQEPGMLIG